MERKRREFIAFDINEELERRGALVALHKIKADPVFTTPLHLFDDESFDYRPLASWVQCLSGSTKGLPVRALRTVSSPEGGRESLSWESGVAVAYDGELKEFTVSFGDDRVCMHRLYLCFSTEDPRQYCDRFMHAIQSKNAARNVFALQLYVDCMPVDFLRPLDPEQISRVLDKAITTDLKVNALVDPSLIVEQYNLNHMRTVNQLILTFKMKTQMRDVLMMNPISKDTSLFVDILQSKPHPKIEGYSKESFAEITDAVKFHSFWNKTETLKVMLLTQAENISLERGRFFYIPEKAVKAEEFTASQVAAANHMGVLIRETWLSNVTSAVCEHLKNIKKGWFNIDESNHEVYMFSKLRRFMSRLNLMMEDSLRITLRKNIEHYSQAIRAHCPSACMIVSNTDVQLVCAKYPLFTVDLKFFEGDSPEDAKFTYSTSAESFVDSVLQPMMQAFTSLKGIPQVERKVMKRLFWPSDPLVRVPFPEEDWVQTEYTILHEALGNALAPLDQYLHTLDDFKELISIDIKNYARDAEMKFCGGDHKNLEGLRNLAQKHAIDSEEVLQMLPSTVSLGLVLVDCRTVKSMLSAKHKSIATSLYKVLEKRIRDFAESIIGEFRDMFNKLIISPNTIEGIVELREYMSDLPAKIDQLSDSTQTNENNFILLEHAKWSISFELMDMRWEVRFIFHRSHDMISHRFCAGQAA